MMKRTLFTALVLFFSTNAFSATRHAKSGALGMGIVLGEPTAVTGKYWLAPITAIDFGIGYSFANAATVYGDFLWHKAKIFGSRERFVSELTGYLGAGAAFFFGDKAGRTATTSSNFGFGVRLPIGLEWNPADSPLGVFVELVPGIKFAPNVTGLFHGGIGLRYYF